MTEPIDFPGLDGFLGTRASLMLDVVFVAMFVVIAVMGWSIFQVRVRNRYALHKWVQLGLAAVLFIAVAAFEIEMRVYGWEARAAGELEGSADPVVWKALYTHLVFAISSAVLWPVVIFRAWRQFPVPPAPNHHSRSHIFWARLAAIDMLLTSITGWVFYVMAFV
ncbi:MAG: DUF420 domain-containing protein [Planctomycetes bacterium]|nr:DUF420 domain-containing protein [Planctomycetota bacterium]